MQFRPPGEDMMSETTTTSTRPAYNLETEREIRRLTDEWSKALRARDLGTIMSCYTADVVFFDGVAPLQIGPDAYRQNWEGYFKWFPGPVNIETRDLRITAGDHVAFSRGLVHLTGTTADGKEDGAWMRQTVGYERIDGKWLIAHEHWSMPMDMESGTVRTDLEPA